MLSPAIFVYYCYKTIDSPSIRVGNCFIYPTFIAQNDMMRKTFLFIALLITISYPSLYSQEQSAQLFILEGVELHDRGEYEEAVNRYHKAVELDSTLTEALYELSLSYLAMKDYENALTYSSRVIESGSEQLSNGAYAVKSEALAGMGKIDEAINLLSLGLSANGDDYLLHFNLALNFFKKGDVDKSLEHIKKAIDINKSHSGAFLLNAYLLKDKGLWMQSILSFQMFLLLEPDSKRSKNAFTEMLQIMLLEEADEEVERSFSQQQPTAIFFDIKPGVANTWQQNSERITDQNLIFNSIKQTIDSLRSGPDGEDQFLLFKTVNKEIMRLLDSESRSSCEGIFWTFYVPFFSRIVNSDYYDTFCRYISVSYYRESFEWWEHNPAAAINFVIWFEKGDNEEIN